MSLMFFEVLALFGVSAFVMASNPDERLAVNTSMDWRLFS